MAPRLFTIKDFINETKEDFNSPTTSTFSSSIPHCKNMVNSIEENLDLDRNGLSKMKKAIKAIYNGGCADSENKSYLSDALEKLGLDSTNNKEKDEFIGAAFVKFSFIIKELSALEKILMQNIHNIVMFPLDNVLKGDLKGVKNDLKKPVDKALKEYDIKMSKIEKEKKAQAKEVGLIRTEITGAETAEEMDRERKQLQYQMCEYLIKVNEIESKKSFDLLLHFIEYFNAQCKYFKAGLEAVEQFQTYISDLAVQLQTVRQRKEDEKRELVDLKNLLKTSSTLTDLSSWVNNSLSNDTNDNQSNRKSAGYSLHQLEGNMQYGCYKSGYLLKKSERSKMRVKMWQKRKCEVKDGFIYIWHSDESKTPTKVNLLTCQIKTFSQTNSDMANVSSVNATKNYGTYFDLVSCNRTYHFQVEDEHEADAWISVLINSKDGALKKEFANNSLGQQSNPTGTTSVQSSYMNQTTSINDQSVRELQQNVIDQIQRLSGNDCCVDCGSTKDPTWLSTNFGVLTCIECSGIHREMGVHISRIQSLTLDNIGTSQLLIARSMSNSGFNDIMEATCNQKAQKPKPNSSMDERNLFIRSKYMHKKFIIRTCASEAELLNDMEQAVQYKDIYFLLQVWAEGANLSSPLPSNSIGETALHYAIMHEFDRTSLHIVDFLIQNSSNLNAITQPDGNTPLHYCVIYNRSECMKLLLRSKANFTIKNANGKTPLDIARDEHNLVLVELLECAANNKKTLFENVVIDWNFQPEDPSTDFSDDDIDDKNWISMQDEMLYVRRGNTSSNGMTSANRFRSSNRKISINKYNENESTITEQHNQSPVTCINKNLNTSRPSSVIGDIQVINVDSNQSNLNTFKTATDNDQSTNFVRSSAGNSSRSSGNRNRLRFSAGPEATFSLDTTTTTTTKAPPTHVSNRAFIAGHSRAASADISGYATIGHGKSTHQTITPNTIQTLKVDANPSPRNFHVRNNSVDNSLVASGYQAFAIHSGSPVSTVTTTTTSNIKPAIPAKPSGIVSVYVPGSTSNLATSSNYNKSTGNIYTKSKTNANTATPTSKDTNFNSSKNPIFVNSVNIGQVQTVGSVIESNNSSFPVPPPRKKPHEPTLSSSKFRRCIALYDCEADQADELSFTVGEVILILNEVTNDEDWMEGMIENDPSRRGLFPVIFVEFI